MKVGLLGFRGFPDVQGGIERHVESLAPLLVSDDVRVVAYVRAPYMRHFINQSWRGVGIRRIWAPRGKRTETLFHTLCAVILARFDGCDVIHIHAVGPAIFTPLARVLGLKVVFTHHGQDYLREKWGRFAKALLQLGEMAGAKYANRVIAITPQLQNSLVSQYGRKVDLIPNGVTEFPPIDDCKAVIDGFGLSDTKFILHVGRLVPEKRQNDLIEAFKVAQLAGWKLVIAGGIDHESAYANSVLSSKSDDIIFLGNRNLEELACLYRSCDMFVLPSSHEGLPIALLEALSFGVPVIVSDIEPHVSMCLPDISYFHLGNTTELAVKIASVASNPQRWDEFGMDISRKYDWRNIANSVHSVYMAI